MRHYPDWLHQELINWSRWCWLGPYPHPLPPNHCCSIESRYIAPSDLSNDEDAESHIVPNEYHARIVQNVYETLNERPRLVLCAEYPKRLESGRAEHGKARAARWLGLAIREYDAALIVAIGKVWDAFEGKS